MSLAVAAAASMTFPQHLVLWLHLAFVAFTIGPLTLAIMSTPRYIRKRDIRIVRYLSRITFIFMLASLGVLIAGLGLAQMLGVQAKWWVIVSATLFVVAVALLVLIVRDQRRAIKALATAPETGATATGNDLADDLVASQADPASRPAEPATAGQRGPNDLDQANGQGPTPDRVSQEPIATAERARIAMTGGMVSVIWLVILVLMVWNS